MEYTDVEQQMFGGRNSTVWDHKNNLAESFSTLYFRLMHVQIQCCRRKA